MCSVKEIINILGGSKMKIIKPYFVIETPIDGESILKHIEMCGRTCYKSEDRITDDSAKELVASIIKRGHESVLEHFSISVRIICDRGVSHEIVRHRLASYSQESTRYCNYSDDKFDNELTFILPCWIDEKYIGTYKNSMQFNHIIDFDIAYWLETMLSTEFYYNDLINFYKWTPQQARSILPHSLKTELVMTANLREWRHFFKLRCDNAAHPQMREIAIPILDEFKRLIPIIFDDIQEGRK